MNRNYLRLNVQVVQMLKTLENLKVEGSVDALVSKKRQEMRLFLEENEVPASVLNLLFYREVMIEKGLNDEEVLELFVNHEKDSAQESFGKVLLDFYGIEHFLRRGEIPQMKYFGDISQFDYEIAKDPEQLVYMSPYFKTLKGIKLDNYRKLMDQTMYLKFKPKADEAIGLDGIVGKVILYNLLLDNLRIKNKNVLLEIDAEKIVRDFHA